MIFEETTRKLLEMRLSAMRDAFDEQMMNPELFSLSFEDRFGLIVDAEYYARENNKLRRLMKSARFPDPSACVEAIDYLPERKLDKAQIMRLASCTYIQECHNVIIQGATGSGKTFLATALGVCAVKQYYSVRYIRLPDLLCDIRIALANNAFRQLVQSYKKVHLLILDEWLLYPLTEENSRNLLEIIESRYHNASTIFCSQFDVKGWYSKISGALLADAICDRIVHDSYTVTLSGNESMRKHNGIPNIRDALRALPSNSRGFTLLFYRRE